MKKILPNGIAVIDYDTHISRWVKESGRLDHDQNTLPRILPYIKPGDWVVDAGAFIGDHTIAYLNAVGLTGRVYAFEPNPEAFECLAHNCQASVNLPFALGSIERASSLVVDKDCNAGATSLDTSIAGEIRIITLDSLRLPFLGLLKLDVEGFEVRALVGARKTILKHRPIIVVELNTEALKRHGLARQTLLSTLDVLGYSYRPLLVDEHLEMAQLDLLCLPKEKNK